MIPLIVVGQTFSCSVGTLNSFALNEMGGVETKVSTPPNACLSQGAYS
jgi:hypothetical protein